MWLLVSVMLSCHAGVCRPAGVSTGWTRYVRRSDCIAAVKVDKKNFPGHDFYCTSVIVDRSGY